MIRATVVSQKPAVVITRVGQPAKEKGVAVRLSDGRAFDHFTPTGWFDPQLEVEATITPLTISREGCILSMASGIATAGNQVVIDEQRLGCLRRSYYYDFNRFQFHVPCYYLFGLAVAKGDWVRLHAELFEHRWTPVQRFQMLNLAGKFYLNHPEARMQRISLRNAQCSIADILTMMGAAY